MFLGLTTSAMARGEAEELLVNLPVLKLGVSWWVYRHDKVGLVADLLALMQPVVDLPALTQPVVVTYRP